jgi:sulfate transport system substrate-binding protein
VDAYVDEHGSREVAEAFVDFLWTPEAQRAFAEYGLRPVDPAVAKEVGARFPAVGDLWRIDFLGGWKRVSDEIYGPDGVFTAAINEVNRSR